MGKKRHIKLKLSKSLRRVLDSTNHEGDLLKRLSLIEQRLSKVESALATSQGAQEDVGIFITDADHSVQQSIGRGCCLLLKVNWLVFPVA